MVFDFLSIRQQKINLEFNGLKFDGILKKNSIYVDLIGKVIGKVDIKCDYCLSDINQDVCLELNFKISNTLDNSDEQEIMYECIDNKVDIKLILESEISSYKSDYFLCKKCSDTEKDDNK